MVVYDLFHPLGDETRDFQPSRALVRDRALAARGNHEIAVGIEV